MKLTVFIALLQWTQAQREIVPLDYFIGKKGTEFGRHGQLIGARAGARLPRANQWRGKLEIVKCGKLEAFVG